jgi:hypothetical protein
MTWPALDPAAVPPPPATERFVLAPLQPAHNERDHAAWMSSIEHIHATPGFAPGDWAGDGWPMPMSLDDNLADLEMHWGEFQRGEAFAYTVLEPTTDDVIGCVYVDPDVTDAADTMVRSWVRASHAHLDDDVATTVDRWLRASWPFATVRWPGRGL